ncbi:uncharacterized protein UV8b_03935 [Ustilaginoidea virens]|uniref:Uncharacterized protein n=1 Tax=Ustilaginoidea virens TaxID=1159556 RepID=A0A8E5HR85_USTVR|nr:uncharacterized protein UV8b_03935 [Ustilaginoidea virens]QUC19694.1 hypothetical protein UV8b_03935 [Ustilaginoidea virens]
MENEPVFVEDSRSSRRGRFMGKLFGKEKKQTLDNTPATLDAFLYGSAAHLQVTHAPPPPPSLLPKLAKLDTTISRYPQALAVNQQAQQNRPLAPGKIEPRPPRTSPRPNRKGMVVRFADSYPDIIGEGGDDSDMPVTQVGKNKRARQQHPPPAHPHRTSWSSNAMALAHPCPSDPSLGSSSGLPVGPESEVNDFQPKSLARSQTGCSSTYELDAGPMASHGLPGRGEQRSGKTVVPGATASPMFLDTPGRRDERRRSFIEIHQAEMREAEAQAFAHAARTANAASQPDWGGGVQPPASYDVSSDSSRERTPSPEAQTKKPALEYSPAGSIASFSSFAYPTSNPSQTSLPIRQSSAASQLGPPGPAYPTAAKSASERLHDAVKGARDDDALAAFLSGTKHLFELFRLHAEAVRPLSACAPRDCARAALWWLLKGRIGLELAIRNWPNSTQPQMQKQLDRQQAYTNLSKGYWLCQEAIPEIMGAQRSPPSAEISAVSQSLLSSLRKLAQSMQRNGFLPPEEPFLPQTIDKSIWLEYPALSQDMVALLTGNWGSALAATQHPLPALQLLDALPLGDTAETFSYGRAVADVFLTEQGRDSQRIFLPCILSVVRHQDSSGLAFVIASQNGHVQLAVGQNRNEGPVLEDVRWYNTTCCVEVCLPRGFLLVAQLNQDDYRMLWNMHEFGTKTRGMLQPRSDEALVFRNSLRSFQYLDSDPHSRMFPKGSVPQCDVALFEKVHMESGPAGQRTWHCGFRIAVVTGPRTRTISGLQHSFPPPLPVLFGLFRAEADAPALSLKCATGNQRGRMMLVFNDEMERARFHSLLAGIALNRAEKVFADAPLKWFLVSQSLREPSGLEPFGRLPWQAVRVINDEFSPEGGAPPTVFADRLKVVVEHQHGTVADRVNVGPGELRVRLEVSNDKILRVLRQPQQDVTMSVSEAQVPRELATDLGNALQLLKANQTIRTFEFHDLKGLHDFQLALTGFETIFDAVATTFAIARRRMVVPIHKKWEAGSTRIQVIRLRDKQLQLLAFFEDFAHGHCMNFVLKGTDVYEALQKGSKAGIRFVDAKFPLPRLPADKDGGYDDVAFVCVDVPDLPGEHDDITVMFDKETDRDLLAQCLPAPAKGLKLSSRLR